MHQCSFVAEICGLNYFFDCGECCGFTAHNMGIDLTKNRAIFISHLHPDHMCGMPHLFFVMQKLLGNKKELPVNNTLDVFLPCLKTLEAVKTVCNSYSHKDEFTFNICGHKVADGIVFEDENIRVSAIRNLHLGENYDGWSSHSYLIEAEGKRVVYSGDVKKSEELLPLIGDGCDLLIHETGHHKVADVCEFAAQNNVKQLFFNHHGREIINGRAEMELFAEKFSEKYNLSVEILSDRTTAEV
jgi:ribonuclease BN (tRNA processing enzyme)